MNFEVTREIGIETGGAEALINLILSKIFQPKLESVIVSKTTGVERIQTDDSIPPKHVQLSSKCVKLALLDSMKKLKKFGYSAEPYSELVIINLFMSDFALAWDLRKNMQLDPEKEFLYCVRQYLLHDVMARNMNFKTER